MKRTIKILLSVCLFATLFTLGACAASEDPSDDQQQQSPVQQESVHTVTIDGEAVLVVDGEQVPMPQAEDREGFYFEGWYVGDQPYDFSQPVKGDLTIVSRYTPLAMTVRGTLSSVHGGMSAGAIVTVTDGTLTKTGVSDADGAFSVAEVPAGDYTVTVEADGFEPYSMQIVKADFDKYAACDVGTLSMAAEYAPLGAIGEDIGGSYALYMTRNSEGFLFKAVTDRTQFPYTGERLEFWLSVGETTAAARNADVYMLRAYCDGTMDASNYPNNVINTLVPKSSQSDYMSSAWTTGESDTTVELFVAYELFGLDTANGTTAVAATDVVGFSMTAVTSAGTQLYYREDMPGASGTAEVVRGNRFDYLRIDSYNNLFEYSDNREVYTLSGTVEVAGSPAEGVLVHYAGQEAATGSDGMFRIQLPAEEAEGMLTFTKTGYGERSVDPGVVLSKKIYTFEIVMEEITGTLTGTVTDRQGAALEGVEVTVEEISATTGEDGKFTIAAVGYGQTLTVTLEKDGYFTRTVRVTPAELTAGAAFEWQMGEYIYRDVVFSVTDILGEAVTDAMVKLGDVTGTETEDGYLFEDVLIGDYTITVSAEGFIGTAAALSQDEFDYNSDAAIEREIALIRDYVTVGTLADVGETDWMLQLTRDEEGIYLKVTAEQEYNDSNVRSYIWFSVGKTNVVRDDNFYYLGIFSNGLIDFVRPTVSGATIEEAETLILNHEKTTGFSRENGKMTAGFYIPYSLLKVTENNDAPITAEDVFGVLFSTHISGQETFLTYDGILGSKNNSTTFVRIDGQNSVYSKTTNTPPSQAVEYAAVGTLTDVDGASWKLEVSRDSEGIYLRVSADTPYNNDTHGAYVWLSVGQTNTSRDTNFYYLRIYSNGNIAFYHQGAGVLADARTQILTHAKTEGFRRDADSLEASFFIPYSLLTVTENDGAPITAEDVFGVLFAVYKGSQEVYLEYDGILGSKNDSTTFVRVDKDCNIYSKETNTEQEEA